MRTPDHNTGKWILSAHHFSFIFCLAFIFAFTAQTIAQAPLPGQLPVNLKTFKARAEINNRVKIFWTTEYEKNNAYFDIERSSDAVNFTIVSRVPGLNSNGILTDYILYDSHALNGISFYRLKQVDTDSRFSYSPIERIRNSAQTNSVDIYPNPATSGAFYINLIKEEQGSVEVLIFDLLGCLKLKQQCGDNNTIKITHQLPSGLYVVKIIGKGFTESLKLAIQY